MRAAHAKQLIVVRLHSMVQISVMAACRISIPYFLHLLHLAKTKSSNNASNTKLLCPLYFTMLFLFRSVH